MKFLSLIQKEEVRIAPDRKTIPASEFSQLLTAKELVEKAQTQAADYRVAVEQECENLKERAKEEGFEEGLFRWNQQLAQLEQEKQNIEDELNKTLVPLALTAVKKIIGKELEQKPETITDIVKTALKPVSQHRKISIFVNKEDLDRVETDRNDIKALFEHLETLAIKVRGDVEKGGCIIETEAGIINAQLDSQLKALEAAFQTFFDTHKKRES
ncbi:MAG: Yop proteins translocation protein L [Chlamydiales bacterium]|nr:Yop proteins translocation protein L [Chlamydiales bacterium]MCH9636279.1 Yop proteins translocation protein L [Chlamydiales bacterium]MCH9703164.1 HrpE/YscL family type III secretion apparatus protein [Chlamydiota bacterium]